VASIPPVTGALTVVLLAVATVTLGPQPLVPADLLAAEAAAGVGPSLATWWLAHASVGHLLANLALLWWVAPGLERHVGPLRTSLAAVGGAAGGLVLHLAAHGASVAIIGSSSAVAALAAYNLVIGWHCPLETRAGRPVLWPSHLFHAAVAVEVIRTLAELATGAVPTGAAAHLGGFAAGVLLCGGLHGRWPARPASRRPLRTRPLVRIPVGT
jgi:membrane associated rhomboid family serine protease